MRTRYWDHETNRWREGVLCWDGRGSMPHEADSAEYWRMKGESDLTRQAPGGGFISQREAAKLHVPQAATHWTNRRCPCGRRVSAAAVKARNRRCDVCKREKRKIRRAA